jgi:hypothetical protein
MGGRMKIVPKNWASFQHYKDRAPPWIKLHKGLIDDRTYQRLPIASRALAPMLWLLASESKDGSFDADVQELAFRLRTSEKEVSQGLAPLIKAGFFMPAQSASTAIADCEQLAVPEREEEEEEEREAEGSATPQSVEPPTLTLTLNDSSEHPIYAAAIAEWQTTYPGVDVMQQLREMRVWCTANPTNRKTKRGISAFVVRWLAREQDKSGQRPARTFGAVAQASTPSHDPDSREAIEAEGIARGVGPWNEMDEQWHIYKARVRGHQRVSLIGIDDLAAMAAKRQGVH